MGGKLILDDKKPWPLTAQIDQIAVRDIPRSCLSTNFLFNVQINPVRTEQFCLYLDDSGFEIGLTLIARTAEEAGFRPECAHRGWVPDI